MFVELLLIYFKKAKKGVLIVGWGFLVLYRSMIILQIPFPLYLWKGFPYHFGTLKILWKNIWHFVLKKSSNSIRHVQERCSSPTLSTPLKTGFEPRTDWCCFDYHSDRENINTHLVWLNPKHLISFLFLTQTLVITFCRNQVSNTSPVRRHFSSSTGQCACQFTVKPRCRCAI